MERILVGDLQVHIQRARRPARLEHRFDAAVGKTVGGVDLGLQRLQIHRRALGQRRNLIARHPQGVIFALGYPQQAQRRLVDRDLDDALIEALARLNRHFNHHRAIAACRIGILQILARRFDIGLAAVRPGMRIDQPLDLANRQSGHAGYVIGLNENRVRRALGACRGRLLGTRGTPRDSVTHEHATGTKK